MPLPQCTRIDFDDEAGRAQLLADGWREVETLLTFAGQSRPVISGCADQDVPMLIAIAVAAFKFDRLHADETVPKVIADASKAKWVVDAVRDMTRIVFVFRYPDPIGFISARPPDAGGYWEIDLLAVHPDHFGKGVAVALVEHACQHFKCRTLRAGTQTANEAACHLYESLGLEVVKRQRTFHR